MLHLIFGTNFLRHSEFLIRITHPPLSDLHLKISHPNYSSPSQRPSFEHAGLTRYTLLSPSITFSLFHSELKTYLFSKSYPPPPSVSVCRTDLMALDRFLDLYARRFLCFSYSYVHAAETVSLLSGQRLGARKKVID